MKIIEGIRLLTRFSRLIWLAHVLERTVAHFCKRTLKPCSGELENLLRKEEVKLHTGFRGGCCCDGILNRRLGLRRDGGKPLLASWCLNCTSRHCSYRERNQLV